MAVFAGAAAAASAAAKAAAWLLPGLLGLLLLALCIPLRARGRVEDIDLREFAPEDGGAAPSRGATASGGAAPSGGAAGRWSLEADWLWGAVQFHLRGGAGRPAVQELRVLGFRRQERTEGDGESRAARRRGRREEARRHKPKSRRPRRRGGTVRLVRALAAEAGWFLPRLWRALGLQLSGDLVYGFPDPFLTGMSQAALALMPWPGGLRLTPDFSQGRLSGSVQGRAMVYPIAFALLLVRTAFRPAVRELWRPRLRSALRWSKTS